MHAGNVGDIVKHVALVATLDACTPSAVFDLHAGRGWYGLGPTGEWTEGLGRLSDLRGAPLAVSRWAAVRAVLEPEAAWPPRSYPGSPLFASAAAPSARLRASDRDEEVAAKLRESLGRLAAGPFEVLAEDGWPAVASANAGTLVVADPPYDSGADWSRAGELAHRTAANVPVLVWYPVKGTSRPNGLIDAWKRAGRTFAALELVTFPLEERRNRLNGAGVLLGGPAAAAADAVAAAFAWLGPRLAVLDGAWSMRVSGRAAP
ncbi:MAG: 23S rRNA (adenine(2030)-N(6))-methyltransferase RlmJ [Myxococcales bacterium]|nr:23S rRNA (adenine(2030)-N(6))-methyltransferase RlmJ [Myxococcales bacterium]MCB9534062.1 23S rRNA (adenine(2030)-N(6))-methyltransferase RlmJ [Myxococcales bacterium]